MKRIAAMIPFSVRHAAAEIITVKCACQQFCEAKQQLLKPPTRHPGHPSTGRPAGTAVIIKWPSRRPDVFFAKWRNPARNRLIQALFAPSHRNLRTKPPSIRPETFARAQHDSTRGRATPDRPGDVNATCPGTLRAPPAADADGPRVRHAQPAKARARGAHRSLRTRRDARLRMRVHRPSVAIALPHARWLHGTKNKGAAAPLFRIDARAATQDSSPSMSSA